MHSLILLANGRFRQNRTMGKNRPPAKYSAAGLLWRGLRRQSWPRVWREPEFKNTYDVVIIGGGVHGLATAYYLAANHGITDVAVVDKQYLGSGGSGRNTAIVRSNYLTPEGVAFYDRSLDLYNSMSNDLNLNVMFSERGHLTLAHTDSALRTMNWRAEVNKLQGIDSSVITPTEIKKLAPSLDVSTDTRYPILGALYHPPGGTIRHDAVVWGYARGRTPTAWTCTRRPKSSTSSARAAMAPTARDRVDGSPGCARAAATSTRRSSSTAPPGGPARSRRWPESACRSPPTRSKPRSPSR